MSLSRVTLGQRLKNQSLNMLMHRFYVVEVVTSALHLDGHGINHHLHQYLSVSCLHNCVDRFCLTKNVTHFETCDEDDLSYRNTFDIR